MRRENDSTSTSLIARARNADPAAWERLCKLYGPLVYQWARGAGLQPEDASDVMQEVLKVLVSSLVRFRKRDAKDSFRGWLWTITRNQIRDHFRRMKAQARAEGGSAAMRRFAELPDSVPSADSESGRVETRSVWRRALELVERDFQPQTWQAFWRTSIQGDAPSDVAAQMGISVWAVYKARARVLQRLREEFDGLLESP